MYFSVITLTTVGYGDFSPATDAGKLFTIFYILIGIGIILSFIDTLHHHYKDTNSKKVFSLRGGTLLFLFLYKTTSLLLLTFGIGQTVDWIDFFRGSEFDLFF